MEDDDARHKREEAERRAKRKVSNMHNMGVPLWNMQLCWLFLGSRLTPTRYLCLSPIMHCKIYIFSKQNQVQNRSWIV